MTWRPTSWPWPCTRPTPADTVASTPSTQERTRGPLEGVRRGRSPLARPRCPRLFVVTPSSLANVTARFARTAVGRREGGSLHRAPHRGSQDRPRIDPKLAYPLRALSQLVVGIGGADGDRTRDLVNAIHARSQLRYSPPGRTKIVASAVFVVNQRRSVGAYWTVLRMKASRIAALSTGVSLTIPTV